MTQAWHKQFKRAPKAARTDREGIAHDSKHEMIVWERLRLWQLAKEITNLRRQVRYPLHLPDGTPILSPSGRQYVYIADFVYERDGKEVIADAKGYYDRHSQFKIAVFEACFSVKVTILKK